MDQLQQLKEDLAKDLYKITPGQAWEKGICIQCKKPAIPNCYSLAGVREYRISALCEKCFDEITEGF